MDFARYRFNIVLRLLLILGLSFGAFIIMLRSDYWTLSIWILVIVAVLTVSLIRFFEKSSMQLYRFVSSIRNSDFSPVSFNPDSKSTFDAEMNKLYNDISLVFRNMRNEKEFHHQYLQILIEHVNTAIVCFTDDQKVQFFNNAASALFGKPYFSDILSFRRINPDLGNAIEKVKKGDKRLVKIVLNEELLSLSVSSAEFVFLGKEYKLVSFVNIGPELQRQELESWKKLIRTITHEVNNSAIPITNLSGYVSQVIINKEGEFNDLSSLNRELKDDLKNSLLTIEKRSNGLVNFINSTRDFTRTHKPIFRKIRIKDMLERVTRLLSSDIDAINVKTELEVLPEKLEITVDPDLFEQVIINLVKNSIEALKKTDDPVIRIVAQPVSENSSRIKVIDNGTGIPEENIGSIFVPYFTTRQNGSGLGLSVCRNIIDLHKGEISVSSRQGSGTVFTIII